MRRRDREITDPARIAGILTACRAASIAFGGGTPYVVPMSYGFEQEDGAFTLYLHCAPEGEKITRLRADARAAFTAFTGGEVRGSGDVACTYTASFDSVCGEGVLRVLEGEEKARGLRAIMAHYAPERTFSFDEKTLRATCVMALSVETITGKHHD